MRASCRERRLFDAATPTRPLRIAAAWSVEALYPLLWALHCAPAPSDWCTRVQASVVLEPLPWRGGTGAFIEAARLRDEEQLRALHEQAGDAHWAVRDAARAGVPAPVEIDAGIALERHRALAWLLGHGADWDRMPTDTWQQVPHTVAWKPIG